MTFIRHITVSFLLLSVCFMGGWDLEAQRRITPVTPTTPTLTPDGKLKKKTEEFDRTRLEERLDANGNIILVDTITGREWVDTTAVVEKPRNLYPLIYEATAGINIWDPLMRILGQEYGGIDFWAELSLHNRFKPIIEIGVASSDITPDGLNYTFHNSLAPFFKLGMNYNVFYNSNPAYQFCVGLRYGFTSFKYKLTDVTIQGGYWGDPTYPDFPEQTSSVGYFEVVFSVKVKIYGPISMGWALKYHSILNESKNDYGNPMFIPGYGKRENSITGGLSIMYTIPLDKKSNNLNVSTK
ncbi:MAG: DUF6048 family protein [Bacteroidales bacterium]|nr:DUF6048 family protein [Bacteroidales bacterium]